MKLLKLIHRRPSWRRLAPRIPRKCPISRSCSSLQKNGAVAPDIADSGVTTLTTASRRPNPWTADEIKTVIEKHEKGESARQISSQLPGRTIQAVQMRITRYKNKDPAMFEAHQRQPFTDEEKTTLLRLKQTGVPTKGSLSQFPNRSQGSILSLL